MSNRTSRYSSLCASLLLRMGFIVRQCWFVGISTSLFYTVYNATYSPRDSSILGSTDWLPLNWTDTKLTLVQWWCNKKRLCVRWMVATRKTAWNTPESSSSFSFSSSTSPSSSNYFLAGVVWTVVWACEKLTWFRVWKNEIHGWGGDRKAQNHHQPQGREHTQRGKEKGKKDNNNSNGTWNKFIGLWSEEEH